MSKSVSAILGVSVALLLGLLSFSNAGAQDLEVRIKVTANPTANALIEGKFLRRVSRSVTFLTAYAGTEGLADRFSDLELTTSEGRRIAAKRLTASDYASEADFTNWKYRVDLRPLKQPTTTAHISSIGPDGGILFLDDILPQFGEMPASAKITVELPNGWNAVSTDYRASMDQQTPDGANRNVIDVPNIEKAVIFIAPRSRQRIVWFGRARLVFNLTYEPPFNVDAGLSVAREIFAYYEHTFRTASTGDYLISMHRFPEPMPPASWEADTRGRTITLLSSDMPFASQSIQRLHEQLRHEMFHWWFPNGVNLSGNYDWFYEGFALYQSLKLGVGTNQIRFDDYLNTLSAAYNIDRGVSKRRSLIEASRDRFGGGGLDVYARGMLVAFLSDLSLQGSSKGKRSSDDLVRDVYGAHRLDTPRVDGNDAVTSAMRSDAALVPVVERYVTGAESIDWNVLLAAAGLEAIPNGREISLQVVKKPSGRQKDFLDRLGYNNWRKAAPK